MILQEKYLWLSLSLLVIGVFSLGYSDPALRPQVLDFAKVALGGVLGLLTAKTNSTRIS
jgi:uncharacterized membrane protein YjgN (DUF898 family)